MGDGSSEIFYEDPSILYISIHRWEYGQFYPSNDKSGTDSIGKGAGEGYNVLWPINKEHTEELISDKDYIYACQTVLFPII